MSALRLLVSFLRALQMKFRAKKFERASRWRSGRIHVVKKAMKCSVFTLFFGFTGEKPLFQVVTSAPE